MVGRINAQRLADGLPSVGFINPTLYRSEGEFAYDILQGNNKCNAEETCCDEGFYATEGWDPVTGFGSVNFDKLSAVLNAHDLR